MADSRAEQNPEVGGFSAGLNSTVSVPLARFGATWSVSAVRLEQAVQRQEGIDAGDGVRLRGRKKALEGEPHERIWHETRPAGPERVKASRGCENLETPASRVRQTRLIKPLHRAGIRCRGRNLMGGAAGAPHYGADRRGGSTFGCALKESASPREEPWRLSRERLQGPRNAKTS